MYQGFGRIIKSNGGLFTIRLSCARDGVCAPLDGLTVTGRGRGRLHRRGELLVGDLVRVSYDDTAFSRVGDELLPAQDGTGLAIDAVEERKNALIRPPMSNLDVLFVTLAVATPEPLLDTVDKLIAIAEFNRIEPIILLTKCELAPEKAQHLAALYRGAGFTVFLTGEGMDVELEILKTYLSTQTRGRIAAFSGASGVGKSTLLNRLFPALSLETGEISRRIERGKNTTRCVELYPLDRGEDCGYLADTPGFTMLEDLPLTFREFVPYIGQCRYTKCSHTKEEGCAVLAAVKCGEVSKSRHQSFVSLYEVLKKKTKW